MHRRSLLSFLGLSGLLSLISSVKAEETESVFSLGDKTFYCKNNKVFKVQSKEMTTYYNELGQRHREDGPAIENTAGDKYWYCNGHLWKIEFSYGRIEIFIDGQWCDNGVKWQRGLDSAAISRLDSSAAAISRFT